MILVRSDHPYLRVGRHTIHPHKIKRVAHYCWLGAVGGEITLNKCFLLI
jgi:hypothetical protein